MIKKNPFRGISSLLTLLHGKSELHFYFPFLHFFFLFSFLLREGWSDLTLFFLLLCILYPILPYKFHLSSSNRPCTKWVILVWGDRFSLLLFSQSLHRRNVLILLLGIVSLYLILSTLFAAERRVPSAIQIIHTSQNHLTEIQQHSHSHRNHNSTTI